LISKISTTYKEIFKLSLPIIAGSAIENLTTLTNTAFLGHVGPIALGASAIGGIFYLALVMVGFGFGIGTQIVISRRYGEHNIKDIGQTLHHAAAFLIPVALLFFLIISLQGKWFFHHFLRSQEVYEGVISFMKFRIWGIFFAYTNILFKSFYIGILRTRVVGLSSAIIALINIFFDFSLIFGHFRFPAMGIAGAGLASVIAEASGTLFFFVYTFSRRNMEEFSITRFSRFSFSRLAKIFKIASPVMAQFAISFGGWFIFFLLVERMGEIPLAVSNIIRTVYMLVLLPLWGFSSTTSSLVSYKIGSGKPEEVVPLMKKIITLSVLCISSLVILLNLFSHSYFSLYTNNPILIAACFPVLIVVSISSVLVAVAVIMFNGVAGTGKTVVSFIIETIVITIYVAWAYYLVNSGKGTIAMVWTSEIFYGLAMGLMSWLYLRYGNWKKARV
jgi:putative MATE family efflux protein